MSMISEQVKNIREVTKFHRPYVPSIITEALTEAADTIEALSAKLAANMERSDRHNGGGWIACEDGLPEKYIDVLVSFGEYSKVNKQWKNSSTDNAITA